MPWLRIDDKAAFHAKVLAAGNEAYGAWVRGAAWSSGSPEPGRIPRATAFTIAKPKVWQRLAQAGMVHSLGDDGFEIHDFFDFNPRPEETEERRAAVAAARAEAGRRSGEVRRARAAAREQTRTNREQLVPNNTNKTRTNDQQKRTPIPIPIPEDPHPNPPRGREPGDARISRPERLVDDGTAGMTELVATYESAVAAATERPFALPNERAVRTKLALAVNTHLRGDGTLRGAFAEVERAVAEWVDAYRDKPGITAGWAPRKFLDWLNAEREASPDEAPPSRVEPPADEAPRPVPVPLTPEERARRQALLAEIESNVAGKFL